MNQNKPPVYRCPECCEVTGHIEGCKAAQVADLVMAKDGRDEVIRTWPERIYLQCENEHGDGPEPFKSSYDVTWCEDGIGNHDIEYVRADLATPASPASPASAPEASEPTDLSTRLRETAKTPAAKMYLYSQILCQAADEIERYYGGMMAWKRTAEAKDAAPLPPVVARKDGV